MAIGYLSIQARTAVIMGVDGRCGSGKTYFARRLAEKFPCSVIHMDDYFLPAEKRAADWEKCPGGNMDFERLLAEVLRPLQPSLPRFQPLFPFRLRTGKKQLQIILSREKRMSAITALHHNKGLLFHLFCLAIFPLSSLIIDTSGLC